jgi:hypothetical protein
MTQSGFPMKAQQILAIVLTLTAGGISLSVMAQRPLTFARPVTAAEIDFASLHRQASDALDNLRHAPGYRPMPTRPGAF